MDEIDELKVAIVVLSASASFISFLNDEEKRNDEFEKLKQYMVILIRIAILCYSINYKWPLLMCAPISLLITVLTKIVDK